MVDQPLLDRLTNYAHNLTDTFTEVTADGRITLSEAWQLACEFGHGAVEMTELHRAELPGDQKRATVEAAFAVLFDAAWPRVAAIGGLWWLRFVPASWVRKALMTLMGGLIESACRRVS